VLGPRSLHRPCCARSAPTVRPGTRPAPAVGAHPGPVPASRPLGPSDRSVPPAPPRRPRAGRRAAPIDGVTGRVAQEGLRHPGSQPCVDGGVDLGRDPHRHPPEALVGVEAERASRRWGRCGRGRPTPPSDPRAAGPGRGPPLPSGPLLDRPRGAPPMAGAESDRAGARSPLLEGACRCLAHGVRPRPADHRGEEAPDEPLALGGELDRGDLRAARDRGRGGRSAGIGGGCRGGVARGGWPPEALLPRPPMVRADGARPRPAPVAGRERLGRQLLSRGGVTSQGGPAAPAPPGVARTARGCPLRSVRVGGEHPRPQRWVEDWPTPRARRVGLARSDPARIDARPAPSPWPRAFSRVARWLAWARWALVSGRCSADAAALRQRPLVAETATNGAQPLACGAQTGTRTRDPFLTNYLKLCAVRPRSGRAPQPVHLCGLREASLGSGFTS